MFERCAELMIIFHFRSQHTYRRYISSPHGVFDNFHNKENVCVGFA